MSHWTHFVTEADIAPNVAPEQWEVEEAWEAERVALCNADNEAEWKEFLDSLPAWQRQWDEAPLRRLKERRDAELCRNDIPVPEGFDEAWLAGLEREARRAEHKGLMVCGDDEWGCR